MRFMDERFERKIKDIQESVAYLSGIVNERLESERSDLESMAYLENRMINMGVLPQIDEEVSVSQLESELASYDESIRMIDEELASLSEDERYPMERNRHFLEQQRLAVSEQLADINKVQEYRMLKKKYEKIQRRYEANNDLLGVTEEEINLENGLNEIKNKINDSDIINILKDIKSQNEIEINKQRRYLSLETDDKEQKNIERSINELRLANHDIDVLTNKLSDVLKLSSEKIDGETYIALADSYLACENLMSSHSRQTLTMNIDYDLELDTYLVQMSYGNLSCVRELSPSELNDSELIDNFINKFLDKVAISKNIDREILAEQYCTILLNNNPTDVIHVNEVKEIVANYVMGEYKEKEEVVEQDVEPVLQPTIEPVIEEVPNVENIVVEQSETDEKQNTLEISEKERILNEFEALVLELRKNASDDNSELLDYLNDYEALNNVVYAFKSTLEGTEFIYEDGALSEKTNSDVDKLVENYLGVYKTILENVKNSQEFVLKDDSINVNDLEQKINENTQDLLKEDFDQKVMEVSQPYLKRLNKIYTDYTNFDPDKSNYVVSTPEMRDLVTKFQESKDALLSEHTVFDENVQYLLCSIYDKYLTDVENLVKNIVNSVEYKRTFNELDLPQEINGNTEIEPIPVAVDEANENEVDEPVKNEVKEDVVVKQVLNRVVNKKYAGEKLLTTATLATGVVLLGMGNPLGWGAMAASAGLSGYKNIRALKYLETNHVMSKIAKAFSSSDLKIAYKVNFPQEGMCGFYDVNNKRYLTSEDLEGRTCNKLLGYSSYRGKTIQEVLDEKFKNDLRKNNPSVLTDKDFDATGCCTNLESLRKVTIDDLAASFQSFGGVISNNWTDYLGKNNKNINISDAAKANYNPYAEVEVEQAFNVEPTEIEEKTNEYGEVIVDTTAPEVIYAEGPVSEVNEFNEPIVDTAAPEIIYGEGPVEEPTIEPTLEEVPIIEEVAPGIDLTNEYNNDNTVNLDFLNLFKEQEISDEMRNELINIANEDEPSMGRTK